VVTPSASDGSILVQPFRAVVGSRNTSAALPSPNTAQETVPSRAAWRDIRSALYFGQGSPSSNKVALSLNPSGNPRWDLVYAQVSVDGPQNTLIRRVKDPSAGSISTPSVPQYLQAACTIAVVTGTTASSPTLPSLPADTPSTAPPVYNIPLAWIRVPAGFGASSAVATGDIRPCAIGSDGSTPVSSYRSLASGQIRPATGNNDTSGTYATGFPWGAGASGVRPGPFMSPDWVGGDELMIEMDLMAGSSSGWSHQNGTVVDDSVDWRNRIFPFVLCQASALFKFANDPSGATTERFPLALNLVGSSSTITNIQVANSCSADATLVAGGATLTEQTNSNNGQVTAGTTVGLYVDMSTGALKAYIGGSGSPGCRLFFYLKASAPFPNL
jgi:hypothetical protein